MRIARFLAIPFLLLAATAAHATSYIVVSDDDLISAARDIVVGTVIDSYPRRAANGMIETVTEVLIDERMKGAVEGRTVSVVHWGGRLGDEWLAQSGAPRYALGEKVLLFLDRDDRNQWTTYGLALGSFHFDTDARAAMLLARSGEVFGWTEEGEEHLERPRLERPFLEYVRRVARGEKVAAAYVAPEAVASNSRFDVQPQAAFASGSYTSRFNGFPTFPIRRFASALTVSWRLFGTVATMDMAAAVDFSLPKWNAQSGSIQYTRSDTPATGSTTGTAESRVVANDPNGVVSGSCCSNGSVIATAFQQGNTSPNPFNGETFYPITHSDVVVNDGTSAANLGQGKFNTAVAHEFGHTLGLRHADLGNTGGACAAPLDCCISGCSAVMKASVSTALSALQDWDKNAIKCVYDAVCAESGACTPPSITTHPASKTTNPPATTSLSVVASGTGPFTYQWYVGNSGDTSNAVGTNSATLSGLAPGVTTSYWVRVTGQCGTPVDSNTATLTVPACTPATVTNQTSNRAIEAGSSTQLTVTATGTAPLVYQWYIGSPTDTSHPTGTNNRAITVSPLVTTTYWAQVTGSCGSPSDSGGITVTVDPCPVVTVGLPTATPSGTNVILDVNATSVGQTLSYAWFRGNTPGVGGAAVGNTKSITVAVTEVASYWVRVTNGCNGRAVSELITVAPCVLPSIATQPADQVIVTGTATNISLALNGDGAGTTVTWYRGTAPDKSAPIGGGTSVSTGPLTATTSFWAAVRNSCGELPTRTAIITVTDEPVCSLPSLTASPLSQQIQANTSVSLLVAVLGEALQYQWYEGPKGDTSKPVGTNQATFVSDKLLRATSFWVRVSNACGSLDSEAAVITIKPGRRRAVGHS
jgi:hypothetical protein